MKIEPGTLQGESGRGGTSALRFSILLVAVVAFILVSATQALATPSLKVNVAGPGSGEVVTGSPSGSGWAGTPSMACAYDGSTQSGTCLNTPEESSAGKFKEWLVAKAAPGSEFGGWVARRGETYNETAFGCQPAGTCKGFTENCPATSNSASGPTPKLECGFASVETGEPNEWEVQATFCPEGMAIERVIKNAWWATNEAQLVGCSPTPTKEPEGGLPDGRKYEQISPPSILEKNGNPLAGDEANVLAAAPDGNASTFYAVTGATETESARVYPVYISRRGATNWATEGVFPPSELGSTLLTLGYTKDLSGVYSVAYTVGGKAGLYLHEEGGRLVTIAENLELTGDGNGAASTRFAAESEGGSTMMFESVAKLTPNAIAGVSNVYVWNKSSGELRLVDVLPEENRIAKTPSQGAYAGPWDWENEEVEENAIREGGAKRTYYTEHALSENGERAFFTTAASPQSAHQIYVRSNPFKPSAETTLVSESKRTVVDPKGPKAADFLEATSDGKFVFFKSAAKLTDDATTGESDEGSDLYRYDVETKALEDLTPSTEAGGGAQVSGLAGMSKDGSYVYFVARGVLAAGAQQGEFNLYAWHEGQPIKLVATLGSNKPDEEVWLGTRYTLDGRAQRQARVSEDGRTMIFASHAKVPGTTANGEPQIFRYTYEDGRIDCISCNPTGGATEGAAALQSFPKRVIKPSFLSSRMTRNMSADGQRVFFQTTASLVPGDKNDVADVYEWEADGEGTCENGGENGGCLSLISTGTSPEPAYFSDASVSGDDVFFFTTQSLVGQDTDDLSDVYDARVGGGLAAQYPTAIEPCETGLACRGPNSASPATTSPGTVSFAGPGNLAPAPAASFAGPENPKPAACKKGSVPKGQKCVKKKRSRHRKVKKRSKHRKVEHKRKNRGPR